MGCHFLFQGIFPIQGSNSCFLHWQADSLATREAWGDVYKCANNMLVGRKGSCLNRYFFGRGMQLRDQIPKVCLSREKKNPKRFTFLFKLVFLLLVHLMLTKRCSNGRSKEYQE